MAKTKLIYRVENSYCRGPYHHGDTDWQTRDHGRNPKTPIPSEDGVDFNSEYVFGFYSLSQLKRWFGVKKERFNLHKSSYKISIYKVNMRSIKKGKKQVAFIKPKRKVKTISLEKI